MLWLYYAVLKKEYFLISINSASCIIETMYIAFHYAYSPRKAKVLRDGRWTEQEASILVPKDIISIELGDIVPAYARLLKGDPLKVDQSTLTGKSLRVTKHPGDEVFSGSTCKQGEIEAIVIATGVQTFFGKAAHLVDSTNQVGHFQKVLTLIGNFCIISSTVRKLTPERKRSPLKGKNSTQQSGNSRPNDGLQARLIDQHRWPSRTGGGKLSSSILTKSMDFLIILGKF